MKISLIQLNSTDAMLSNIAHIDTMVAQAAQEGAQLVALPENAFLMEAPGVKRTLYSEAEHPGIIASGEMAKKYGVWLLAGTAAGTIDDSGKTVNRSVLFDDQGRKQTWYDKIHLFDVEVGDGQSYHESARFLPGHEAAIAKTPWAVLGMSVCYDVRFPQLYRALAKAGAQILAVPSAFTQVTGEAHWHVLLRARAIENSCFVIAPAQWGTHAGGRKTFGHSLIIDPWGKILADGREHEGVVTADIDLEQVAKVRAKLPSLMHDRPFTLAD
jgi:predicted amidohydrolase